MDIKSAKYIGRLEDGVVNSIHVKLNNDDSITLSVPLDPANTEYAEIMRQVDAGELTIAPADEEE